MKKSQLKKFLILCSILGVLGLYQWNKTKIAYVASKNRGNENGYSSQDNTDLSFSPGGTSANEGVGSQPSGDGGSSFRSSPFGSSSSVSFYESERRSGYDEEVSVSDEEMYTHEGSTNTGRSDGIYSGGGIGLSIPVIAERKSEKENKEKASSTNANAAARSAFASRGFGNQIPDLPMAPVPPDQDVPLDDKAYIIFIAIALLALVRLKNKSLMA